MLAVLYLIFYEAYAPTGGEAIVREDLGAEAPVIALNRAVAHGMAYGPAVGLEMIEAIDGLDEYHLLHAARADLLRRLGRHVEASAAYGDALRFASRPADREYLSRRLEECAHA